MTPGPWRVDLNPYDGEWRVYADERNGNAPIINSMFKGKDAESDARLISAAPEMLEALNLLQAALTEYKLRDVKKRPRLLIADAAASSAIHKATGGI